MARTRRTVGIDEKIADAQEAVVRAKARYDKACKELELLMAKRDAMRKDELWAAVVASEATYEDILAMVRNAGRNASGGD